jgi:hypothetical protein
MLKLSWVASAMTLALLGGVMATAQAAVERIDIRERVPFAAGTSYGEAGAYEKSAV